MSARVCERAHQTHWKMLVYARAHTQAHRAYKNIGMVKKGMCCITYVYTNAIYSANWNYSVS